MTNPTVDNEVVPTESRGDVRAESGHASEVNAALIAFLAGGRLRILVAKRNGTSFRMRRRKEGKKERKKERNASRHQKQRGVDNVAVVSLLEGLVEVKNYKT